MSAELVETSKLWGRVNAKVLPEWAEEIGAHLVKRSYSEPHWSKKRAAVLAYERVTLVRRPARRRPAGVLRQGRPGAGPRAVHPARARLRRVADPAHVLRGEPRAARGGRGARAPGPTPRHHGRRAHPLRLLRRTGRPRRRVRRALRLLVEAGPAEEAGPAHLRPRDAGERDRLVGHRPGLPGHLARGRPGAAADLPVRAGHGGRRGDCRRAGRHAQPRRARRRSPGRSPACGTSWWWR